MATTEITVGDGGSTEPSGVGRWSDLPDDLIGVVRSMVSSLGDRVRFVAVCKPWRVAVSRLPAPPAVPLLLLSPNRESKTKHLCGPDGSWVLRVSRKVADMRLAGSHSDGWVAAMQLRARDGEPLLRLRGGGTLVEAARRIYQNPLMKIIFSRAPTSAGCMLATITDEGNEVGVCKLGCRSGRWSTKGWNNKFFTDIAFCGGDLYGLVHRTEELIKFRIDMEEDGTPVITTTHHLAIQRRPRLPYDSTIILELHGKLLMAVRTRWLHNHEHFFKVFRLANAGIGESYEYKWEEVSNFGDYAFFLGPRCSMAVHVPVGAERRGLERNHIYYSNPTYSREKKLPGDEVYSVTTDDGVCMYRREKQDIGDGVTRTGCYVVGWHDLTMWVYPPDL